MLLPFIGAGDRDDEIGPTVVVQEGGYYIEGLESNAARFFAGLAGT